MAPAGLPLPSVCALTRDLSGLALLGNFAPIVQARA